MVFRAALKTGSRFASKYGKTILVLVGVSSIVAMASAVGLYVREAERNRAQVRVLAERVAELREDARTNAQSVETCMKANEANRAEAEKYRVSAILAAAEAELWRKRADYATGEIHNEAKQFERGLGCSGLDGAFRKWLLDGT